MYWTAFLPIGQKSGNTAYAPSNEELSHLFSGDEVILCLLILCVFPGASERGFAWAAAVFDARVPISMRPLIAVRPGDDNVENSSDEVGTGRGRKLIKWRTLFSFRPFIKLSGRLAGFSRSHARPHAPELNEGAHYVCSANTELDTS